MFLKHFITTFVEPYFPNSNCHMTILRKHVQNIFKTLHDNMFFFKNITMLFERFSTLFILVSATSKPAKKESAKKHETRVWVAAWSPARELPSPVMTDQTDALSSACKVTVTAVVCSVLHNCRCRLCLEWLQFILSCIFTLAVSFELSIKHADSRGGRRAKTRVSVAAGRRFRKVA